jgi:hypothetical protein
LGWGWGRREKGNIARQKDGKATESLKRAAAKTSGRERRGNKRERRNSENSWRLFSESHDSAATGSTKRMYVIWLLSGGARAIHSRQLMTRTRVVEEKGNHNCSPDPTLHFLLPVFKS